MRRTMKAALVLLCFLPMLGGCGTPSRPVEEKSIFEYSINEIHSEWKRILRSEAASHNAAINEGIYGSDGTVETGKMCIGEPVLLLYATTEGGRIVCTNVDVYPELEQIEPG